MKDCSSAKRGLQSVLRAADGFFSCPHACGKNPCHDCDDKIYAEHHDVFDVSNGKRKYGRDEKEVHTNAPTAAATSTGPGPSVKEKRNGEQDDHRNGSVSDEL